MNNLKTANFQQITMNNLCEDKQESGDYILNVLKENDLCMIKNLENKLTSNYRCKLNLINLMLSSDVPPTLKSKKDYISFFKTVSPMNNEYNMGSMMWNHKNVNNYLFFQNSVVKDEIIIVRPYINKIKCLLEKCDKNVILKEIKSSRFYKNIDIIFVVDFN